MRDLLENRKRGEFAIEYWVRMYEEQFHILENLLERSGGQEIWSIYSLCNHCSKFESLEQCREILNLFVKYLAEERKDLREEVELVYLIMGSVLSEEITHKLVFESDLLFGGGQFKEEGGMEVNQSNLYGIVLRSRGGLGVGSDCMLNSSQFHVECEDVYKSIMAKSILSSNLWSSRFSSIKNTESRIYRESCGAGSSLASLNKSEEKCKTEPYPALFSASKASQDNTNKSEDIRDEVKGDDSFACVGNNTDPCPRKCVSKTGSKMVDIADKEGLSAGELDTEAKVSSKVVVDHEMSLFNDEDIESDAEELARVCLQKTEPTKRRKTTKSKDGGTGKGTDSEKKVDFDPLEVEPIAYSKVKKERMYKDTKTGYLVVEDDVDFVIEKENKSSKQTGTTRASESVGGKKASKRKKSHAMGSGAASGTSKQQTLASFFKIVKPNTGGGT